MLAEDVTHLLTEFGSELSVKRTPVVQYDPSDGLTTEGESDEGVLLGVFINFMDENVNNTTILMGDRGLLVAAREGDMVPQRDDLVDGLRVLDVRTIAPNGTAIAYACHMRA